MFLIALGSNISGNVGAPRDVLEAALDEMGRSGVRLTARSNWWQTPAHPPGSGPDFVNAAVRAEAACDAEALLHRLHDVEARLGRLRPRRWAPRVCDLDLLAFGSAVLPDRPTVEAWMSLPPEEQERRAPDQLILPHPRLHERAFVLLPLGEVAPDWTHPVLGLTVRDLLHSMPAAAREGIRRL